MLQSKSFRCLDRNVKSPNTRRPDDHTQQEFQVARDPGIQSNSIARELGLNHSRGRAFQKKQSPTPLSST